MPKHAKKQKGHSRKSAEKKKRNQKKWSVVSFFSGCGGLDLGFVGRFNYKGVRHHELPYQILRAYDNDKRCLETYRANMHKFQQDLDPGHAQLKNLASFNPTFMPPADVLIGGFPCQEFSLCGPRGGVNAPRGKLYKALITYAKKHRPKVLVGENVPGLASIAGGAMLANIKKAIEDIGYRVEIWPMFAPDYGVPQSRARIFIIAVRNDIEGFPKKPKRAFSNNHRSTKWAIHDLKDIKTDKVANQSQYFKAGLAKNGNGQGDEKSAADEPAYTIRANAKSRVQFHYSLKRRLTIRECARLQTFPDNFEFPHAATTNIMQIGNAVPPRLGHLVAKSVSRWLDKASK